MIRSSSALGAAAVLLLACSSDNSPPVQALHQDAPPLPLLSPDALAIQRVMMGLRPADAAPDEATLQLLSESVPTRLARDDAALQLYLDADADRIWVRQTGGFPGTTLWYGPGPASLLPPERALKLAPPARPAPAPADHAPHSRKSVQG